MPKILNRYIKKSVFSKICIIFSILIFLSIIIKLLDEMRNFDKQNHCIFKILLYTTLNLPKEFDLFLPIATLLGGLLSLSSLETRNELTIIQIFGLSKLQITCSVIKVAIFISLFNIISNEWLLPYGQKLIKIHQQRNQYDTYSLSEKNKNLWLIENNSFIFIEKISTTQELLGINLYYFINNVNLQKVVHIHRAKYMNQHWILFNVTTLNFFDKTNTIKINSPNYTWNTTLTPDLISIIITDPRLLSISNLKYCINYFNRVGQNSKYYQLIFWNKILSPITGIIMIMIAVSCSWNPLRKKNTNTKLFFGSILGFIFYIIHQFFGSFSMLYNIPPIIGSIGPIIFLTIINTVLIVYQHSKNN